MIFDDPSLIVVIAVLAVAAALLVWLSLTMASAEGAVSRVTRASLNNLILETQTDQEMSQFTRMKRIERIHKVQKLIADRYATSGSCMFFRISCNVLDGVLVMCIASLCGAPLWLELVCGVLFALIVAVVSVLVRPRAVGALKPVDIMIKHAGVITVASALTPFARVGGQNGQKRRRETELFDDE